MDANRRTLQKQQLKPLFESGFLFKEILNLDLESAYHQVQKLERAIKDLTVFHVVEQPFKILSQRRLKKQFSGLVVAQPIA